MPTHQSPLQVYTRVLNAAESTLKAFPYLAGIPSLNITRPSSSQVQLHTRYLLKQLDTPRHLSSTLQYLLLYAIRSIISLFKFTPTYYRTHQPTNCDILYISHLIHPERMDCDDDFHYGPIPSHTHQNGHTSLVALFDHINYPQLTPNSTLNHIPLLVFPSRPSFSSHLYSLYSVFSLFFRFLLASSTQPSEFSRLYICSLILSASSLSAYSLKHQFKRALISYKPNLVYLTWEGHAWERLFLEAISEVSPTTFSIAYQHSSLSPFQHASFQKRHAPCNPHRLCLSSVDSYNQYLQSPISQEIAELYIIGNKKSPVHHAITSFPEIPTILVLPEGIDIETKLLFDFSLAYARLQPNHNHIWRLHPSFSFERLLTLDSSYNSLPKNVTISDQTLYQDVTSSSHLLYRGSTAVVQGLLQGRIPIYLSSPDEITRDPLFQLHKNKYTTSDPYECSKIVASTSTPDHTTRTGLALFASEFFLPLNYDEIMRSISL